MITLHFEEEFQKFESALSRRVKCVLPQRHLPVITARARLLIHNFTLSQLRHRTTRRIAAFRIRRIVTPLSSTPPPLRHPRPSLPDGFALVGRHDGSTRAQAYHRLLLLQWLALDATGSTGSGGRHRMSTLTGL